jgi:hypothetical protein
MSDDTPEEPEPEDYFPGSDTMYVYSEEDIGSMSHELFAMLDNDPQLDYSQSACVYISNIAFKLMTGRMDDNAIPKLEDGDD